jgi:A/G-specific adenine glycosylase
MSTFSIDLLKWWKCNGRSFPWRVEKDPYKLLIAEFLLHRTRAKNVVSVYSQFIEKFPTVKKLTESDPGEIERMLHGIGLRWRVDGLLKTANLIQSNFDGRIPMERKLLLSFPGIGDYIASAVRVFSGGFDDPLIDTNTARIISRIYDLKIRDSTRKSPKIRELYSILRDRAESSKFGFALIDLGPIMCLPKEPRCIDCPVVRYCITGRRKVTKRS